MQHTQHPKYSSFDFEFSSAFSGVASESFSGVRLPYYTGRDDLRVLIVLDYMPTEDLRSGKLLSGVTRDNLNTILQIAQRIFVRKEVDPSWMACTYNAYRTAGKPQQYQQQAREEFTRRLNQLITRYRPDVVLGFGRQVLQALIPYQIGLTDGTWTSWLGVPVECTTDSTHVYKFVGSLSLNPLSDARSSDASLIGYMARNVANALTNSHLFGINDKLIKGHKSVLIDTIPKFDKLMTMIRSYPIIAIDTEANNLNRVVNKLLTMQFAKCPNFGYLLPIYHKDTPFDASELKYITTQLRLFFEGRNKNEYHIYVNAQFDLNLMRGQLGIRYYANRVWDCLGAEYCLDENLKYLKSVAGDWFYSLGNLAIQYGTTAYIGGKFGKADRANVATTDLKDLQFYATLDVVIPWAIHEQQKALAEHIGHKKYETLVTHQISDMLHVFSLMETNGSGLDVNYLFHLKSPQSPIEDTIKKMELKFLENANVQKANARLLKKAGVTSQGLFAGRVDTVFSLRKVDHKQLLFFDILKLKPLARGVAGPKGEPGLPKLDKGFQEAYKDVPEVAYYTELGKARKLKNAFVDSFIKLLGRSDDLKHDHRIRPRYNYLPVVTNRTSCTDPNLQQIPARSALGKNIKRLFVARCGTLYIKVDYRVHEVRGWGLISNDLGVADLFKEAKKLREQYRAFPTPELKVRLKNEADIHVINAAYFFSTTVDDVDKVLRNAVKSVIFGLIYQMSVKTLAKVLGKDLDYTKKLVANFTKRFPNGMKWIQAAKDFARKHLYYENPLGFRRHLWGYTVPDSVATASKLHADADRRAVNAPIQGMCSEFSSIGLRALDTWKWDIFKTEKRKIEHYICNTVHDSAENEAGYANFLEVLGMIEESLTTKVKEIVYQRYGFSLVTDLEVDVEIGSTLANCQPFDCALPELERICWESIVAQRDELNHDVDPVEAMKLIFTGDGWKRAPKWLHKQARNTGWTFKIAPWKKALIDRENGVKPESKD